MNSQINPFPKQPIFLPEQRTVADQQGFRTQDIVWAIAVWSVILCLSPVVMFYILMVN